MSFNIPNKSWLPVVLLLIMLLNSCGSAKKQLKEVEYDKEVVADRKGHIWGGKLEQYSIKKTEADNDSLYVMAEEWIGAPYLYGGNTLKGVDCSGFVVQVYLRVFDKKLERSSARIFQKNCNEIKKDDLQEGDLVFFSNSRNRKINHVGIYLKDGMFVHASSKGVVVDVLTLPYYEKNYITSGRVK